ncbi:hypothetical protein L226DRAFT_565322 [Lentinus tigrinus ALCF2SS1-7]|uniref:Homeobox domain-containing protein n=1 Tax=Lentinus tigrinus ALCF2SS1-6 TaxID=1328759 RepID=A0A5C2SNI4_9APHY|nr:hypothetical protein L227DRAFT_607347 [Lentinus tigrinus ALCF2SS1-6]RPD82791.1 hypothetical protein L226DRAFT_565322 [Lentinus tigrinus ALCF2SS1-7]
MSSMGSDDSMAGFDASSVHSADTNSDGAVKRTRKRFSSVQLMMLEHLYRKASHPTREEREQVAKDAEIDIRSVTVWFQNKRQTDRRIHRQLSEPVVQLSHPHSLSLPPSSPMPLPPSSPFSDASGNTIHTVRVLERTRTRTLSGNSTLSATSRKRDRDREHDASHALARHVRHKPARTISLDDIAARAERPALLPRTPPQLQCVPSSSSPARPQTPEPEDTKEGKVALWQNMPSSPAAPEPVARSEREFVRYGYGSRRLTLEYACAREMMGEKEREREKVHHRGVHGEKDKKSKDRKHHHHRKEHGQHGHKREARRTVLPQPASRTAREMHKEEEDEENLDIPVADWDMHDTDTEGVLSEAPVTPSSSFDFGGLSMQDPVKTKQVDAPKEVHKEDPVAVHPAHDDDVMNAAYALFNLSQRR